MTASSSNGQPARFLPLEQADFQRTEHGSYLKAFYSLLKVRSLEYGPTSALRDDLIGLAQRRVQQARAYPFSLLDVQLAQQTTGAGTTFLRWRNRPFFHGRGAVESLLDRPATPALADRRPVRDGAAAHRFEHAISLPSRWAARGGSAPARPRRPKRLTCDVHGHAASVPSTTPKGVSMSTHFARATSVPRRTIAIPNGSDEPRRLRLNVYFDNPIPRRTVNSRTAAASGRRWAVAPRRRPLERPVPEGHARAGRRPHGGDEEDADDNERTTFKIEARRIGILPYRIEP